MSEELNKYEKKHEEHTKYIENYSNFVDTLVEFQSLHVDYMQKQSLRKKAALKKVLKRLRFIIKEMETSSLRRKYESRKNQLLIDTQEIINNKEETNE